MIIPTFIAVTFSKKSELQKSYKVTKKVTRGIKKGKSPKKSVTFMCGGG